MACVHSTTFRGQSISRTLPTACTPSSDHIHGCMRMHAATVQSPEEAAETSRRRPGAHDSVQAGGRKKPRDEHEPRATYHELQATSH